MLLGLIAGAVTFNFGEWWVHKNVLHEQGMASEDGFWSFHWHEHHKNALKAGFVDETYERFPLGAHAQGRELAGLLAICVAGLPVAGVSGGFYAGIAGSAALYYALHKHAHNNPEWAKKYLRWHYDHHMAPNQHANWCVSYPLADWLMGTRKPYVGSERFERDEARRMRRREAVQASAARALAKRRSPA